MKKLISLLPFILLIAASSHAQLLKKLKEKAESVQKTKNNTDNQATTSGEGNTDEKHESSASAKWVPTSECEKVFSLEKGETFFYDETKVAIKNGKLSYSFIIRNKNSGYFLIEDGKRNGPFTEAPLKESNIISDKNESAGTSDNDDDDKIDLGGDNKDGVAQQYTKTISNKLFIVFNGKNFGPYDYVAKMKVSADKKKFWAIVVVGGVNDMMAKMGMGNSFIVNEAGVKQKGGEQNSIPVKMMVSENFSAAAISLMDNLEQKAITVSSTGKKQEGNLMDLYADNKSFLTVVENGDIISIPSQSPTQLLVNGTEEAAFKIPVTNLRRLFILPDYKKSVYYQSGKLYRGDGSVESLTGVVFPKVVLLNNQPVIYYYKIHETETGDKDVYLCKKVL